MQSTNYITEQVRGAIHIPERVYVFFALLYFAGALSPSDTGENGITRQWQFDQISYFIQLIVFPILALLIFSHSSSVLNGLKVAFWPLALCGLAVLSAGWSDDPFFTARRAIILLLTTLFAVYLGSCFTLEEQSNLFGWLLIFSVSGSILVIIFAPQFGISHDLHEGALKGLFSHKNLLGRQMVFGILTLLIAKPNGIPKWLSRGCLAAAFLLLILSRSAGALITLAIVLAFYGLLVLPRKSRSRTAPLWIGLIPILASVSILVISNADVFLEPLGRDTSLTGRVPLWAAIGRAIEQQPWLGHGYAIFWVHTSGSLLDVVATGWNALSSQNGYLDLCLDLGVVGLALFLGSLVFSFRLGARYANFDLGPSSKWPLTFFLFFALQNFHESDLLRLGTFLWVPCVALFTSLALMQRDRLRVLDPANAAVEGSLPAYGD
jgi:exopolysaccharide production protein ExoQ